MDEVAMAEATIIIMEVDSSIMIEDFKITVEVEVAILEEEVASVGVMTAEDTFKREDLAAKAGIIKMEDSSDAVAEVDTWTEEVEAVIEEDSKVVITFEVVEVANLEEAKEAMVSNRIIMVVPEEWAEEEANSVKISFTP